MAVLKKILILLFLCAASPAWACPACAASNNGRFFNQTLFFVAVMGLLPLLIAGAIGLRIYRLCRGEQDKGQNERPE